MEQPAERVATHALTTTAACISIRRLATETDSLVPPKRRIPERPAALSSQAPPRRPASSAGGKRMARADPRRRPEPRTPAASSTLRAVGNGVL